MKLVKSRFTSNSGHGVLAAGTHLLVNQSVLTNNGNYALKVLGTDEVVLQVEFCHFTANRGALYAMDVLSMLLKFTEILGHSHGNVVNVTGSNAKVFRTLVRDNTGKTGVPIVAFKMHTLLIGYSFFENNKGGTVLSANASSVLNTTRNVFLNNMGYYWTGLSFIPVVFRANAVFMNVTESIFDNVHSTWDLVVQVLVKLNGTHNVFRHGSLRSRVKVDGDDVFAPFGAAPFLQNGKSIARDGTEERDRLAVKLG